ncbi:MAG TPA: methyltransferase domain-containing protein [Polyangia bacterium]|jgi:SAM-dependent methyltransferase
MRHGTGTWINDAARRAESIIGVHGVRGVKILVGQLNRIAYHGVRFECPVCDSRLRRWSFYGHPAHGQRICPVCRAAARHRYLWYTLTRRGLLPRPGERVLHVSPEWILERKLRDIVAVEDYLSVDLLPGRAMRVMDLTAADCAGGQFDLALGSHVLEHIPEDRAAMRELHRLLRAGGRLLLQVPINRHARTDEDPSVTSSVEREARFGQGDHVRVYGLDLAERLREAGFSVDVCDPRLDCAPAAYVRHAFDDDPGRLSQSIVFLCRKA